MSGLRLVRLIAAALCAAGILAALMSWRLLSRDAISLRLAGREIEVLRPQALVLLSLLPVLWAGCAATLSDMARAQVVLQAALRTMLVVLLCLCLCRPEMKAHRQVISLAALVDVSDSISEQQLASAASLVDRLRIAAARGQDQLHLLTFAARPKVLPLQKDARGLPALRTEKDPEAAATDIQAALKLSYGLHAPGTLPRALIISDGNQTEGDLLAEAQAARRRGVRIYHAVLPVEQAEEVLVRELRLGGDAAEAEIKVGAPFLIEAEVYSSVPQRARLTLLKNGAENPGDGQREVDLAAGRNLLRFRSEVDVPGFVDFALKVSAPEGRERLRDRFPGNNQALLSLSVRGRPRVLYVEGEQSARGYLERALLKENIDVEVRNPYGLPASARELARFDLLLLSDVSSTLVSQQQMAAIDSYVRDLGGGFIMTGGEHSFGSGGYQGTLIEKVLPVRFEQEKKRDQPSLGLILCIDRSGSMNGPKLELAKDAAKATAEMLGADDLIGVVAFDSAAIPLVRLQRAQNRVRISTDIARLQAGGGTNILPALQEAYQQLSAALAKIKHVILLTDGQAEYQGILELVDQMVQNKITISAVGVGAGADQTLLTAIAEHGGGRFYFTQDATSIPKIFTKETTQVARSALVEDRVRVVVQKRVELLDGTAIESAPPLRGYVATKAKPLSETILSSNLGEPILVRWRHGLGQAVAFTSDVKNRWAVEWLRWPGYARFFAQLVRTAMRQDPRTRGNGYDLRATVLPPHVHVVVDAVSSDDRFVSGLATKLEVLRVASGVAKLGRPVLRTEMAQTAPGRYEADLTLESYGAYLLRAVHRARTEAGGEMGPVVAESWGQVALSYPREYLALPADRELLSRASHAGGGSEIQIEDPARVLDPGEERVVYLRALWPYLCGLAALLLVLDVALRRVRLFGYRPLSRGSRAWR